ncbi:MAG: hypothetical protein ACRD5B_06850 [Nitrososphaeraceae archaeon]
MKHRIEIVCQDKNEENILIKGSWTQVAGYGSTMRFFDSVIVLSHCDDGSRNA